jgi:2-polyprenyl-3-methyl-5-hydroxy-6-metoxy-1,4-benzoquinol methylase
MSAQDDRARVEAQIQSCYSTWAKTYFDEYYAGAAAYPPVHVDIVRKLLQLSGAKTLLDAGCGPASMLRRLADLKLEMYGFDLTAEMVDEARRSMAAWKVPPDRFWQGSVAEAADYRRPASGYDAAICFGVFPHVPESLDEAAIANLHAALAPGGTVAIEARNRLFALFTLNRYSRDLFLNELIGLQSLPAAERAALAPALAALDRQFRVDLPPVRQGKSGEPGYDEVLSRTHNPLVMRGQLEAAGFRDVRLHFYHYHALPPMLESYVPGWFRQRSLALENPADWRGHFMASAFIVSGVKGRDA